MVRREAEETKPTRRRSRSSVMVADSWYAIVAARGVLIATSAGESIYTVLVENTGAAALRGLVF
jgi:hypothetical protein